MTKHDVPDPMDGGLPVIGSPGRPPKKRKTLSGSLVEKPAAGFRVVTVDEQKRSRHVVFEPMDGPVVIGGATLPKKGRVASFRMRGRILPVDED